MPNLIDFVCVKKCFWVSLREQDQIISVNDESDIPPSVRPFFDFKDKVEEEKASEEDVKVKRIAEIKAELEAMKVSYDSRWGIAKLEHALTMAKRDKQ